MNGDSLLAVILEADYRDAAAWCLANDFPDEGAGDASDVAPLHPHPRVIADVWEWCQQCFRMWELEQVYGTDAWFIEKRDRRRIDHIALYRRGCEFEGGMPSYRGDVLEGDPTPITLDFLVSPLFQERPRRETGRRSRRSS